MTSVAEVSPRLDVVGALGETVRGLPRMWRGAWGASALTIVAGAMAAAGPQTGVLSAAVVVVLGLSALALTGALLRIGLDVGRVGPAGLQLGRTESRLVGAGLLCLLLIAMIAAVLGVALLGTAGMADLDAEAIGARDWSRAGEGWKLAVVAAGVTGAVIVVASLLVRLSLFAPATVARGRMVSLDSFILARGSGWPLLAGLAATSAPVVMLMLISANVGWPEWIGGLVWAIGLAALQAPLTTGFMAAAYRRLDRAKT